MSDDHRSPFCPIAIVGVGTLAPGATDVDAFWRQLLEARDLVTDVPADRWRLADYYDPDPTAPDKSYCGRGAFLPDVEFDAAAFGMPPNNLPATDTSQLLALIAAAQVLADAPELPDRGRVSVILGSGGLELMGEMSLRMSRPVLLKVLRARGVAEAEAEAIWAEVADHGVPFQEATFPGLLTNIVAGRIANRFDLQGANCTVDAACASSLAALSLAIDDLALGRSDLSITGGVDTASGPMMHVCFSKTPGLSRTGDCRPFADDADGTVFGDGLAMFAVKRLADAERDGDRIYAVIRGLGSASDGRSRSIYAPLAAGQARALRRAYAAAGYGPDTVGLMEAHGTATAAGDAAEVAALREVFAASGRADRPWCALGSIKSQIGHTKAAAGALGLLKAALALHHKVLPPTIKVDRPNPQLELDTSPFYLDTAARPWLHVADHPRRASVSSFGFGGTNFHVTLEEYVPQSGGRPAARCLARPAELVVLSADSPQALVARATVLASELGARGSLAAVARRSQEEFSARAAARLAIVAPDVAGLGERLAAATALIAARPDAPVSTPSGVHFGLGADGGRIAFLFPGQGAQYPGMSADLAMHFASVHAIWERVARMDLWDRPLADVVFPPRDFTGTRPSRLAAAEWAQPALAAHSLALLGLLDALGVRPACVAGHSFGELIALHAARAFDADTLVRIARRRGELMRDAATTAGAMLAVDADHADVAARLAESGLPALWLANHNAPQQVVVSGAAGSVAAFAERLAAAGVPSHRLTAATAFHSPIVADAAAQLHAFLDGLTVRSPLLDVYSNADARIYPIEPPLVRRAVREHLVSPVRFVDMILAMHADGVRTFVEVGPGTTLTGLVGAILAGKPHHAIAVDRKGGHGVTTLFHALARLAALGVPMTFEPLWQAHAAPKAPAAATGTSIRINGGNYGRRYPPEAAGRNMPPAPPSPPRTPVREPHPPAPEFAADQHMPPAPPGPPRTPVHELHPPAPELAAGPDIVQAMLEIQRQTAEAHAIYLRTAEQSLAALLRASSSPEPRPDVTFVAPARMMPPPQVIPPPPNVAFAAPPQVMPPPPNVAFAAPPQVMPPPPSPVPAAAPVPQDAPPADMAALVLSVVAEKTGYPAAVLGLHMDLEADLGVDSITRMHVLAALRGRFPGLADVDQATVTRLATLRTLADLAGALERMVGAAVAPESAPPLTRQITRAEVTPASGEPLAGLDAGPLIVTDDGRGVARALVRRLAERGVATEVRADVPSDAAGVVFLGGLAALTSVSEALTIQRAAFQVARAVAPRMSERGGVFVVVQDTGGDFGSSPGEPTRAWSAGLAALARTAEQEWPKASVKAIDCEFGDRDAEAVAAAIAAELLYGGAALDVGLAADGTRRTLRMVDAPAAPGPGVELGPASVLVVTGGGRGVTAIVLRALAQAHRPRIAILGRTSLASLPDDPLELADATSEADLIARWREREGSASTLVELRARARRLLAARELRATLSAVERSGSPMLYFPVDVRDHAAVHAALAEVRARWGPIAGVLHGAGVPADQRIHQKTDEQFAAVFDTKVEGLRVLLAATAADPLRLLHVFSSVAGRFGYVGQCDYAMANATLDHVIAAEQLRRPDCHLRALQWGPWTGGMVTPSLAGHLQGAGVRLIEPDRGVRAVSAELAAATTDPRVMLLGGPEVNQLGQVSFVP